MDSINGWLIMETLPSNIKVHKLKKPKNWAYPFKTSEIVASLNLGELQKNVSIFYDNSPERPYRIWKKDRLSFSFAVLSITYYGHLPENDEATPGPYFHMCVRVCKPEYRQRLLEVFKEILPIIKNWMDGIQTTKSINSISLRYEDFSERTPPRLVLSQRPDKKDLFSIKIDLKEKDG